MDHHAWISLNVQREQKRGKWDRNATLSYTVKKPCGVWCLVWHTALNSKLFLYMCRITEERQRAVRPIPPGTVAVSPTYVRSSALNTTILRFRRLIRGTQEDGSLPRNDRPPAPVDIWIIPQAQPLRVGWVVAFGTVQLISIARKCVTDREMVSCITTPLVPRGESSQCSLQLSFQTSAPFSTSKVNGSFLWDLTWTKRYLITSQTRVKRVSRIHHRRMVRWCIRLTRLTLVCEVITIKWCIKAAAYVQFFNFLARLLFKCGFYLRAVYMQCPESAKPLKASRHM